MAKKETPAKTKTTPSVPAVKENKSTALALVDMEADAGSGFENADKDSYAIPFLALLQKMSPQCDDGDGAYIKGAKPGMFLNTATGELLNEAVVIPCEYQRAFVEWTPREQGGGFRGSHKPSDPVVATAKRNDEGRDILPNGNILNDTRYHYALIVKDGSVEPVVISMTSTQLKKSKAWMTLMSGIKVARADGSKFTPATFSHMYKLTSVNESNDKGSWKGFKVELVGPVKDASMYAAAKQFRDQVSTGKAKADESQAAGATVTEDEEF